MAPTPTALSSLAAIRRQFPALRRRHRGQPVAFFDGPGGTQVPRQVPAAMSDYLLHHNANTHWVYPTSEETDALLAEARATLATLLGAAADEIAFGPNMTSLTFHLARALGRDWGPGDEVVITELDHHANIAPWCALERERGVRLRRVSFDPVGGELDWDSFDQSLSERTRLVALGAASNALGTITDVARAARAAKRIGALTFVDAVHYTPHCLVDVAALGCDFLACSPYKFYGPHLGVLWGRRDALARLDVPKLEPAPDTVPERLETGTQNHEGIVGAAAAVRFLAAMGEGSSLRRRLATSYRRQHERGAILLERLWHGLAELPAVRLFGPAPGRPRTPTVSFTVADHSAESVARTLARRGVFVSHGDFYATTVVQRLGQADGGVVRAGAACYTSAAEVDRLITGVAALKGGRG